jgi:hypothetical protein
VLPGKPRAQIRAGDGHNFGRVGVPWVPSSSSCIDAVPTYLLMAEGMLNGPNQEAWQFKSLIYGGTCVACGGTIDKNAKGWHNRVIKKARCASCGPGRPDPVPVPSLDPPPALRPDPVGGTSTLKQFSGKNRSQGLKGATGEYLMDRYLHKHLTDGEVILTDRRVPGGDANIDHVVVASSGVWIIDSKMWEGKIVYKAKSMTSAKMKLKVGGEDRTAKIQTIYNLVIPVAGVIDDRSVPIHPAMVFVEGDWGSRAALRFIGGKPYNHEGVWLTAPIVLKKLVRGPGPLTTDDIARIGSKLDKVLTPRWPG